MILPLSTLYVIGNMMLLHIIMICVSYVKFIDIIKGSTNTVMIIDKYLLLKIHWNNRIDLHK